MHWTPQSIPVGRLLTLPVPVPVVFKVRITVGVVASTKVAVQLIFAVMANVPAQPVPVQPVKVEPVSGVAVSVTTLPDV